MPRRDENLQDDHRWLKRHARRVARSPASVDDLVQETYLTALSRPPPDGPMRPWLLGVLRKLAWGEARTDRRRAHREELFHRTELSVAEPDTLLAFGVDPVRLRATVDRLPEPFRSTVEQRFLEGLSCVEIARAAGVPAGTVRWRQSRALEMLRDELEPPQRRRVRRGFLWLPLLGLERAAAVGRRVLALPGRRGALALLGAALILALATVGGEEPPLDRSAAGARAATPSSAGALDTRTALLVPTLAPAGEVTLASVSPEGADGDDDRTRGVAASDGEPDGMSTAGGVAAAADRRSRELYDCTEVDGELRCVRQGVADDRPGGPVCVVLDSSLVALDRALFGAPRPRSLHGDTFLRAARLADLLLAAELGCGVVSEPEEEERGGGGGGGGGGRGRAAEPVCQSEEDGSGRTCTTCTDERGVATTVCAPVDCQDAIRTDGTPCTTCTDADGQVDSDCELEAEVTGCDQVLGGLDVFALEILPILTGAIDLNEPAGTPQPGCARGPCHGNSRPDAFSIAAADPPESNLARFACFVDLARPEASQILLCAIGDEGCAESPHPAAAFSGPEDLNYQRILAYLRSQP